jgi:hypothetical protein
MIYKTILISLLFVTVGASAVTYGGGMPGAYLELGSGARPAALNAYSAIADDASTIFYNPGGLDLISGTEIRMTYNRPYSGVEGITSASLAVSSNLSGVGFSLGAIGLGVNYFRVGELAEATEGGLTGNTFTDYELEAVFGWGKGFGGSLATGAPPTVYVGMGMKLVQSKVYDFTDKGFGMDIGTIITPINPLRISLVFDNLVAPNIELISAKETYPFRTTLGTSYDIAEMFVLSGEGRVRGDGDYEIGVSGEFDYEDMVFIRGGYEVIYETYAFGAGFKYDKFAADFTYKPHQDLGATYIATLGLIL